MYLLSMAASIIFPTLSSAAVHLHTSVQRFAQSHRRQDHVIATRWINHLFWSVASSMALLEIHSTINRIGTTRRIPVVDVRTFAQHLHSCTRTFLPPSSTPLSDFNARRSSSIPVSPHQGQRPPDNGQPYPRCDPGISSGQSRYSFLFAGGRGGSGGDGYANGKGRAGGHGMGPNLSFDISARSFTVNNSYHPGEKGMLWMRHPDCPWS